MTIVFDAVSTDTCGFNAGRTIAHTIGAGTGRVLVAMGAMNASGVSAGKVTSVTFNGTAMTLARFDSYAISANFVYIYPIPDALAAGAYNVVWTFNSSDVAMEFRQASFSGCDLATPFDSNSGASNGTQTSPQSVTLTPSAGGVLVGIIGGTNNADPYVLGASQIEIGAQTSLIGIRASGSYKTSGTDLSHTWVGGARQSTLTAISLKAAAGSSAGSAAGATLTGASTITGGAASSGVAGSAPGATLTGTSTITGGTATATNTGTFMTQPLKNNTGTVLASETGITLNIYNQSTGALVVQKIGVTTNASGIATVTDALIVAGTTYAYEPVLTGGRRRLPTKAAT